MDAKRLVEMRKLAEQAVSDMPDGELKVKAFEVMLSHLLGNVAPAVSPLREPKAQETAKAIEEKKEADSLVGRILVLRGEGFFKAQRSLGEVREELQAHGWHYPLTTLSGTMQGLVQRQELRRQRIAHGQRKVWKYSNR